MQKRENFLLLFSIISIVLNDDNKSPKHLKNQISNFLKIVVLILGRWKRLYSAVSILFLYINILSKPVHDFIKISDWYFFFLMIVWWLILWLNPNELTNTFSIKKKDIDENAIGEIFWVQSKKIFLVKLFEDRKNIKKFNIVKFRYSMQESDGLLITWIVFDTYLLNKEKWAKVLQLWNIEKGNTNLEKNVAYKITDSSEKNMLNIDLKIDDFVWVVIDWSGIWKIKFEYSKKVDDLQEWDLLELIIWDKRLFYQVVNWITEKEKLEARNETGFIEWEAIQLWEWKNTNLSFHKFWWVPTINTPIFKADTSDIEVQEYNYPEFKLGIIPNTTLPSVINLHEATNYHMALLWVTGSWKSFIARKIINELQADTKVICVDFTWEWKKEFSWAWEVVILNKDNINKFLEWEKKFWIVELPSLSNTSEVIKATEKLFEIIFDFAKKKYAEETPIRISLVLEEAHTITPETSFLWDMWDYGSTKALVNKMWQIALQWRKYGVWLLIIAQRTANVSKTILTQCNTVICFKAFDETSFNFLWNYIWRDLVQTLPNLKDYHAIVTWKAIKSNFPMIIDMKEE